MECMCPARHRSGEYCDLGREHDGPHIHFGQNGTLAWDLYR